jgi:hypothetical protein
MEHLLCSSQTMKDDRRTHQRCRNAVEMMALASRVTGLLAGLQRDGGEFRNFFCGSNSNSRDGSCRNSSSVQQSKGFLGESSKYLSGLFLSAANSKQTS